MGTTQLSELVIFPVYPYEIPPHGWSVPYKIISFPYVHIVQQIEFVKTHHKQGIFCRYLGRIFLGRSMRSSFPQCYTSWSYHMLVHCNIPVVSPSKKPHHGHLNIPKSHMIYALFYIQYYPHGFEYLVFGSIWGISCRVNCPLAGRI